MVKGQSLQPTTEISSLSQRLKVEKGSWSKVKAKSRLWPRSQIAYLRDTPLKLARRLFPRDYLEVYSTRNFQTNRTRYTLILLVHYYLMIDECYIKVVNTQCIILATRFAKHVKGENRSLVLYKITYCLACWMTAANSIYCWLERLPSSRADLRSFN